MNTDEKIQALKTTLVSRGWVDIIRPALDAAIASAQEQWETRARPKGQEGITDDMLRGRIIAMKWVLGWEKQAKALVDQLEQVERMQRETEPATDDATPY